MGRQPGRVPEPLPDRVVSAAWLAPIAGTRFAGLWGGSTLQVDASDDSRPILERLGLVVVGGTTPYVWTPPA